MKLLYNTGIFTYRILANALAPFNEKANQFIDGRAKIYTDIPTSWKKDKRKVAHFHAASLGEFEQARPVIEQFKLQFPSLKILLTFFSPSGYEVQKNYIGADYVCYLPFDTSLEAKKFTQTFNPIISFFVKYEFWFHTCQELHKNDTHLVSFSSIFREKQSFFKWYGKDTRETLHLFDYFFVQNKLSKKLLGSINIKDVSITGDTRFDRVNDLCKHPKPLTEIKEFIGDKPCFVIGSSWKEDLEVISPFLNSFNLPLKTIIAPHNISANDIKQVEEVLEKSSVRYSKLTASSDEDILILDNMGMLSSVYQFATICHIGGGFKTGLHNTLEAATYGKPLIIGPHYKKFDEVINLVSLNVCLPVQTKEEFKAKFTSLYNDTTLRENISNKLEDYIQQNLGASDAIISYCKELKVLN
jgi:3-deoxy-D-manno-octulosonic-acid transferase